MLSSLVWHLTILLVVSVRFTTNSIVYWRPGSPQSEALIKGPFRKTVSSKDAASEPIWMYSRRVLRKGPLIQAAIEAPAHAHITNLKKHDILQPLRLVR
jgi:hypothetical protein